MSSKPTPDQLRAKHAWETAQRVLDPKNRIDGKVFGGAAKKLPVRIMASGLGQALAFLHAKGKTPALLDALGDWVLKDPESKDLLAAVINGTTDSLRQHTVETLAYLQWLNRFCEANHLTDDAEE
jgi:CRISPR-associated protein Cmr5